MGLKPICALAAAAFLAAHAGASTVQVASGSGRRALPIVAFDPVGQSFTATDTRLSSFGFQLQTANPASAEDRLIFTLHAGAGTAGSIVATAQRAASGVPAARTPTWVDFSLDGVKLTAGQTYTATLVTTSDRLALIYGPDGGRGAAAPGGTDAYVPGRLVAQAFRDAVCSTGTCDANFRYTADTPVPSVPEPASWGLMILGFGLLGGALRRRAVKVLFGERSRRPG